MLEETATTQIVGTIRPIVLHREVELYNYMETAPQVNFFSPFFPPSSEFLRQIFLVTVQPGLKRSGWRNELNAEDIPCAHRDSSFQ